MAQHSWKSSDFIEVKKIAEILYLKLVQAFARVSLETDPITTYIFWVRSLNLLWDFALNRNLETPHTKLSKGLQSGELGGQTSCPTPLQGSLWASPASSCCCGQRCRPAGRCNGNFWLSSSLLIFVLEMFKLFFNIVNSALIVASIASCWFNFAAMCFIVFIYASADSWDGLRQQD